jgi:hypothetical protein
MPQSYIVYLLRMWRAGSGESSVWRASIENPHTGERHGFADLNALLVFLEGETTMLSATEPDAIETGASDHMKHEMNSLTVERALYELIGRAITDVSFRARLIEDPEQAAREEGYRLTAEQMAGLRASDLQGLAENLDERLSKKAG